MAILKDLIVNGASRFIGDAYFNTIKAGVWNGTAIDVAHGGTGRNSVTSGYLLVGNGNGAMNERQIVNDVGTSTSATTIPTSGAVYAAISAGFAANGAMVYKGTYTAQASSSSNVVESGFSTKPGSASLGWTWVVTGNNSYFGNIVVEAGDMIISNVSNPGTTISNYYVIQTNIDVTHYVTTNTAQTITGAKTFNAETTFNKQATFNKGLISTSIGDSDTDVLFVSGNSSFNDIVNIYGQTNHGNHVIPMNNNAYDLGSSSLKWRNVYAGSVTATTFTGSLSGNASSATTASSVSWDGVTNKPINFKTYSGSLASGGWKTMQGKDAGKVLSISYNNGVADWNSGTCSASLVYGCADTRGLLDLAYNKPIVTFGGSNINGSTDDNPSWYMKLTGTSGTTYNLNSMPYATSAGQVKTVTSSSNASYYLTFVDSNNSSATAESVYTNSGLYYNPNSNTLTANVFYGSLAGNASLSSMLSSHYSILGSTNNAQGHWFKFATLSFNNTTWAPFDEWLFFGSTENTTYCPNGILRISGRQSNNLGYAAQFEIYWISLGNIWYRDKVVAIKTANCVFDLYISNYGTYESICIYRMANSSTYQRLVFNSDNNRSWIATLPTPAAATVNGEKTTVTSSLAGYSYSADKLTTSRTLTIGDSSKTFDGSGNISWTLSDIGAASSSSLGNYLPLSGGTLTGALGKSDNYLIKPVADYRTKDNSHTGCIAVTLPATIGNTMVSMWIDVYNYVENTSFSVHCGGYTYSNSTLANNPFAIVYGASHRVRLGHNGTNFVVYIGETNSSWSYPQVTVRDVLLGYSPTYTNWYKDWTISFVTSVSNVTADITRYAITSSNIGLQSVNYATSAGKATKDSDGNTINSTYLKLSGGTLTGDLTISKSNPAIVFQQGTLLEDISVDWRILSQDGYILFQADRPTYTEWANKIKFDYNGNVEASKFVKTGGTSSQFLKADGSIDSNTYVTTSYIDNLSLYTNKSITTSSIALVPTEWKQLCQLSATTLLSSNYGTYVVQITKGTGSSFVFIGSGIMSFGTTNSAALEEIVLHCYGGDDNRLYLGTQNGYLMGAAKVSQSAAQYTITFKRII